MSSRTNALPFRSILCPVDFSPHAREAVRYAVALAQRTAGRVTALFVNDPLLVAAASAAFRHRDDFDARSRTELERFVRKSVGAAGGSGLVACDIAAGNPTDEILRQAKRRKADVIVVGTHGLSGVNKMFFGSTTEQLLRRAQVPVLAIPPALKTGRKRERPWTIARVLAPIDLSGHWQADAVRAADIARGLEAELVLVHVLSRAQLPPWLGTDVRAHERQRIDKTLATLERVRLERFADRPSSSRVLVGSPADEIAKLTSEQGQSLVVMSLRGTNGVWGARRGSIAYRVLTQAVRPVLALPAVRLSRQAAVRAEKGVGSLTKRDRVEIAGIDSLQLPTTK